MAEEKPPTTLSLYALGEQLGAEEVKDVLEVTPGTYMAVIGKTQAYKAKEAGKRDSKAIDFVLISSSGDQPTIFTSLKGTEISLLRSKKGDLMVDGIIRKLFVNDATQFDTPGAANFFALQKKKIAKIFSAWNEETLTVNWQTVQAHAGVLCSISIEKDERSGKYLNVVPDSIQLYHQQKVTIQSLANLYDSIAKEYAKRENAATSFPPPDEAPSF